MNSLTTQRVIVIRSGKGAPAPVRFSADLDKYSCFIERKEAARQLTALARTVRTQEELELLITIGELLCLEVEL